MRSPSPRGFTFIEVILALGVFLAGVVGILALFTSGVNSQLLRRADERVKQVRPEVLVILQEAVNESPLNALPAVIRARPLSIPGYTLDVDWTADPFGSGTAVAHAWLLWQNQRLRRIGPQPVSRTYLESKALRKVLGTGGGGAGPASSGMESSP